MVNPSGWRVCLCLHASTNLIIPSRYWRVDTLSFFSICVCFSFSKTKIGFVPISSHLHDAPRLQISLPHIQTFYYCHLKSGIFFISFIVPSTVSFNKITFLPSLITIKKEHFNKSIFLILIFFSLLYQKILFKNELYQVNFWTSMFIWFGAPQFTVFYTRANKTRACCLEPIPNGYMSAVWFGPSNSGIEEQPAYYPFCRLLAWTSLYDFNLNLIIKSK